MKKKNCKTNNAFNDCAIAVDYVFISVYKQIVDVIISD